MKIRIWKDIEDKLRTKPLYQEAFSDGEAFLSYYYTEKCRDNRIVTAEEGEDILSMIHLNPYRMMVDGREYPVTYLVAGATKKSCRGKGYYRAVIDFAAKLLEEEGQPFCYLMPADRGLYQKLGFEWICQWDHNKNRSDEEIRQQFDIYCIQDETYKRRRAMEEAVSGETDTVCADQVIMGRILDLECFCKMSGLSRMEAEQDGISWLQKKRIYLCEEV